MQRLLQKSLKVYKGSVNSAITSQCPSVIAGGFVAPSRCYSVMSLNTWLTDAFHSSRQLPFGFQYQHSTPAVQVCQLRSMSKLTPKFTGGKLKPYSSYKERFKTTANGLILFKRPGHRHKRFSKGPHRNRQLRRTQVLTSAYTATMQRLGFVSRRF